MHIKEVHHCLQSNLSSSFSNEGYTYNSNKEGFKKNTSFGFVELVYGITNYDPKFIVEGIGFLIRLNVVEEICVNFNQIVDEIRDKKKQATIFGGYGGLVKIKNHDFGGMYNLDDVKKVSEEMKSIYFDILKPFIEQHSDIHFLENEINKDTDRDLPYILYWRGRRAMRGIILAKLCLNPRYEELKSIYHQKCVDQDDSEVLEAYNKLVYYLDNEFQL